MGARALVSSIAYRAASNAAPRCGAAATTRIDASPSGTDPVRWTIASLRTPNRASISSAICPSTPAAIGSNAS
jgi:hypothetical protein